MCQFFIQYEGYVFPFKFKELFIENAFIEGSGFDLTVPVISLKAWFFITSNLFKMTGVAVTSDSQPHCRTGFMYALYVAFSTSNELPHLVPAGLFRTFSFLLVFSTVFSMLFLHVSFPSRYIPKHLVSCVYTAWLSLIFKLILGLLWFKVKIW
jgi:hypothetical protein